MSKQSSDQEGYNTSFLDLIFNMALFFSCVFMLAMVASAVAKAKEQQQKEGINPRADLVIITTWPSDKPADVDSYLQDPAGRIVMFQRREDGLMHLDRDDLGDSNDSIQMPDGSTTKYDLNREMITVRGLIPGEYVMNIHMYNIKSAAPPIKVTVEFLRTDPTTTVVFSRTVELKETRDEVTIARFIVDAHKNIVEFNQLPKKLIK